MKRRAFIKANAGLLAGLSLLSPELHGRPLSGKKVVIVGAGMAGAAAARALKDGGCEVTVLEARSRIGGRIHTFSDWGYPIELGANWIHDTNDPTNSLRALSEKLNVACRKTNYGSIGWFDQHGNSISKFSLLRLSLRFNKALKQIAPTWVMAEPDSSLAQVMEQAIRSLSYSAKEKTILELVTEGMANMLGTSLHHGSAKYYLTQAVNRSVVDFLVTGGYQRLVEHLLTGIQVELNAAVREIREEKSRVEIVTDNRSHDADYVMLTVPISILQQEHIIFNPALPDWKVKSFSKMQMGSFNKVIMEFHKKFWKDDKHFYMHHTPQGNAFGGVLNYHRYTGRPVLVSMPVDRAARWVESNDLATVQATWKEILHKAYPGKEIEFKKMMVTRWCGDRYSQGSYSHVPVGATSEDFDALRAETGRVYFAGEATQIAQHGTVHGAYNSGVREAMKILTR